MAAAAIEETDYPSTGQRWAILFTLTLSVTLYGLTVLVVTVLLPQMQGALSATQDQIAWVMTFNILATAVVTPMTGWLAARFGRKRVMLGGTLGFTLATVGCGGADSLTTVIVYRIAQGAFGAPLVPLGQAIVLDSFPRAQHGTATAVFGIGVVLGPAFGPSLGGWLAEEYSWRLAFFMLVPLGIAAFLGLVAFLPDKARSGSLRLDWTGFLALSIAVVCFQLILDRGQRLDWFDSPEIVVEAAVALVALWVFLVHTATADRPFLNPRLLKDRNYALGLVIVAIYGMLNFTPMVLLPPMLKSLMGVPDSMIGQIVAARGVGAVMGFFLAMWVAKLDPRIGMAGGFVMQAYTGWLLASYTLNAAPEALIPASIVQGMSVGVVWVPLTVATFATLPPRDMPEGSAVFHLLRNLGSSVFIAASVALVIVSTKSSYAGLAEVITPFAPGLADPAVSGRWSADGPGALASLAGEITRQAAMIGYLNAFWAYTFASLAAVPLVLLVKVKRRPAT